MQTEEAKASFLDQVRSFPANFWVACFMEILERLAFFGVRAIAPLYLVASSGQNGLELNFEQKGIIYLVWALLQCLIPMVSGGFTDRYGYRKSLAVAFTINILGYLCMAKAKAFSDALAASGWEDPGFWVFMVAACLVATGTAIFKPPAQGTVAASTDEETSSVGWGIFYWVVNIGGALAPMAAAVLRVEIDWDNVFYFAAIVTALNFIPGMFFFKEPEHTKKSDSSQKKPGIVHTFFDSIATIFSDLRLVVFLAIFSCFWLMFMQLWDLLPNFIDEWVDTRGVAPWFAWFNSDWVLLNGQTKPEMIINIDSIAIILFVIPLSWMIARISKVAAMVIGMLISLVGFVGTGATSIGWLCCLMVFVFSIGEMTCSPTFNAYIGLIAPKEKKALYMGYANIPFAIGWALGNGISGYMYEAMANKTKFAREFLVNQLGWDSSIVMDAARLPKEKVMNAMAWARENGNLESLKTAVDSFWGNLSSTTALTEDQSKQWAEKLDGVFGSISQDKIVSANQLLWDQHHPYLVWYYLGLVGLAGTIGMIIFYFMTRPQAGGGKVDVSADSA